MSAVLEETQNRLITADELFMMPNTKRGCELVRGRLIKYMPTGMIHGIVATQIGQALSNFVRANNLGIVVAADSAFVGSDKLAKHGITEKFFPDAPDLTVEVVSPSDRKKDIEEKVKDYLSAGVQLVWIIYPQNRIAAVYRQNNIVSILREDDEFDGEEFPPNFRLALSELFDNLPQIKK